MTHATVSIVSHGHHNHVAALLTDLSHQTIARDIDVVLTLNIPEPEHDLTAFAPVRVRVVRNDAPMGFGANHNAALSDAATTWVLVVNPDIRLHDPTLLAQLLDRWNERGLGVVAPLIRNSEGKREDSVRDNLDPISLFRRTVMRYRTAVDPAGGFRRFYWIAGMFMALPLVAWRDVGGFDERFFLYCEDYDLCARLVGKGHRIEVDETLIAVHDAQRTSRNSTAYLRWHIASLLKVWTSFAFWRIWASDLTGWGRRIAALGTRK